VVLPIAHHKPGVLNAAKQLAEGISKLCRVKLDDSDNTPGWKFAEYEMKGVPLRIELGPRDIENGQCVVVTRHNRKKHTIALEQLPGRIAELLEDVRLGIYEIALKNRESKTYTAGTLEEAIKIAESSPGFIKTMWCGDERCELAMKEKAGLTSRCMPFEQERIADSCPVCGKPAETMVVWGKAY
jgi:prolyl-tRNA synthetase